MARIGFGSDLILLVTFGCLLFAWTNAEAGVGPWSNYTGQPGGQPGGQPQGGNNLRSSSSQVGLVLAAMATVLLLARALVASRWVTAAAVAIAVLWAFFFALPALTDNSQTPFSFLTNTFAAFSSNPLFATLEKLDPSENSDWILHLNESPSVLVKSSEKSQFWLESALSEQATILHFSRLAENLIAIGAPSGLIRRAYQAALDEVGHAQLAFGLAKEFDPHGLAHAPGTFEGVEQRHAFVSHDLDHVCLQNLGGAGTAETLSLFHVADQIQTSGLEARERDVLQVVLREETQHIVLAWNIAHWCVEAKAKRSGDDVNAVQEFKRSLETVTTVALRKLVDRYDGTEAMIEVEKFVRAALPIVLGQSEQKVETTVPSSSPLALLRQELLRELDVSCSA